MKANLIVIWGICFLLLCSSYSQADLELLSSTLRSGDYQDVYVVENLAYFVNGRGLEIYNLDALVSPDPVESVGEVDTSGYACGVFVSGNYAYVSDYWDGLAIINVADPENPGDPGYVPGYVDKTYAPAEDVFVMDWPTGKRYAYVANGWDGLVIVDVTDPENPRFVTSIETDGGYALGVFVREGLDDTLYAYVANGWMDDKPAGLAIINVTDPEDAQYVEFVPTEGSAEDVFVTEEPVIKADVGVYAHVAAGYEGLVIIEVTNPETPGEPIYIRTPGYASGVYVRDRIAYMSNGFAGLVIVKSLRDRPEVKTNGYAEDVFVSGNYAYVANSGGGIAVVDLSEPPSLFKIIDTPGYPLGVFVDRSTFDDRNYAFVADHDAGIAIVDVENPSNPGEPIWTPTVGVAEGVFVSRSGSDDRNYAYVADHARGLAIIDVDDPTDPKYVFQVEGIPGVAFSVFVSGNYAYIACDDGGLAIVDVTDPRKPEYVTTIPTPGSAMGVFVSGGYAYVACGWDDFGDGSLAIYDVSDPEYPRVGRELILGGYAFGVYISENIAYVAYSNWDYTGGLAVIDVTDPTDPKNIADVQTGNAFGVHVNGDYAYVANHDKGLAVVDISVPTDASVVDMIDTSGWAYGVFAESASEDALVYVADQYSLTIIEHTVICVPPLGDVSGNCVISAYDSALILQHVAGIISLDGDQKYRADVSGNGTISGLDAAWVLQYTVGLIIEFPAAPALSPKDEQKLLASAISDLERVPLSQEQRMILEQLKHLSQSFPARTALLQNYPNPFNPETWIPYQLEKDSNVTIRIMNIQGRLVRQINLGSNPAGAYVSRERAAYWDGRNTFGEKVSSGIYFYTLQVGNSKPAISTGLNEAGKFTATRKMVIMK